jgi:hypothetical protein
MNKNRGLLVYDCNDRLTPCPRNVYILGWFGSIWKFQGYIACLRGLWSELDVLWEAFVLLLELILFLFLLPITPYLRGTVIYLRAKKQCEGEDRARGVNKFSTELIDKSTKL